MVDFMHEDQRQAGQAQQEHENGADQAAPFMDPGPDARGICGHEVTQEKKIRLNQINRSPVQGKKITKAVQTVAEFGHSGLQLLHSRLETLQYCMLPL
jgi:hypothetical protein